MQYLEGIAPTEDDAPRRSAAARRSRGVFGWALYADHDHPRDRFATPNQRPGRRRRLSPAARVLRRARTLRDAARMHIAWVALHADRAFAGTGETNLLLLPHRRAVRRVLRAGCGQGIGTAGRGDMHLGDRGGELGASGDRSPPSRCSPDRAHRRPTTRATRGGSRPDDRPAQAVRRCGQVVLRCRSPGRRGRSRAMDADACMQGVLDGARGPTGPGPSQLPVARTTRRPRPPTRRPRARTPRRHTVGASCAGSVHSCAGTRPTPFGKDCRRRGRRDRQSGGLGELLCSEADSVARRPAFGGTTGPSRDRPLRPYPA